MIFYFFIGSGKFFRKIFFCFFKYFFASFLQKIKKLCKNSCEKKMRIR
nr:MAG TPA: hypothetical protein [Caudoviricetes sp.]